MEGTSEKHRILLASSEVMGYAKTGGLADVAAALPRALAQRGHDCAVVLPLYRGARTGAVPVTPTEHTLAIPVGTRTVHGRLWRSTLPDSSVPVWLVDQPDYFDRDDRRFGHGLYQFTATGGHKRDYHDNCQRYVFFCRAVLETLRLTGFWPDVLHLNDWQTGLVPVYLRELYSHQPGLGEKYAAIRTLFTIHNIGYQGTFWSGDMPLTGLDWKLFNPAQLEFYDQISFLKGAVVFSDLLNTVSPTYAREIQTPYFGCGLQGALYERRDRLFGIVNGVDYKEWDPAADRHLPAHYGPDALQPGKAACKAALQARFGLAQEPRTPLLGVVARLVEQKGIQYVLNGAEHLLGYAQIVVLGEGDQDYHYRLQELQGKHPDRVGLLLGFDEALAHLIEAGADIFLMPSQYEPSGLNQLYSMKYGTVPVVRATGGLADTVTDTTPESVRTGTATGFRFVAQTVEAFLDAVHRALRLYHEYPDLWQRLMVQGMRQDWSWQRSAGEYEQLYARLRGPTEW